MYYIYILRCEDNSLYCGITNNLERRMYEHFNKTKQCAKYTKNHCAKSLVKVFMCDERSKASTLEYHLKKLSKSNKELLISDKISLNDLLEIKYDCDEFKVVYPV